MSNLQSIKIGWYDKNVYSEENKELLHAIRGIHHCMEFVDETECERFIGRGINNSQKFILIISGALGQSFVPTISDRRNIYSIYIYCGNKSFHETWTVRYGSKVKVTNSPTELVEKIKADIKALTSTI
ncbi:hypothetical protein I4U23_006200 [Adineta vaga]|nr:hypothetical protein I4U23_006200 [Adineta vaga]